MKLLETNFRKEKYQQNIETMIRFMAFWTEMVNNSSIFDQIYPVCNYTHKKKQTTTK